MAQMKDVVFDCEHPASLARFWAAAMDGHEVAPYDEAELARLKRMGVDDPEETSRRASAMQRSERRIAQARPCEIADSSGISHMTVKRIVERAPEQPHRSPSDQVDMALRNRQ